MADGTQELETIVGTGVEPRQTCIDARLAVTTDVLMCSDLYWIWIRPVMFCSVNNVQKNNNIRKYPVLLAQLNSMKSTLSLSTSCDFLRRCSLLQFQSTGGKVRLCCWREDRRVGLRIDTVGVARAVWDERVYTRTCVAMLYHNTGVRRGRRPILDELTSIFTTLCWCKERNRCWPMYCY